MRSPLAVSVAFFLLATATVASSREYVSLIRERHWAVTPEKFELAMERIRPEKRSRKAVILSHGFFVGGTFLNLDEDHSLAQYLAREGFDVWNLSFRGTGRSLNPLRGGPKIWSLDDMIEKDIEAVIAYVRKETNSPRVGWVGFEMGGLVAYGYLQRKADAGLGALVTLGAPVTFTHPEQEPMKRLLKLEESPTWKRVFLYLNGPFFGKLLPFFPKIERLFYNSENIEDEVKLRFLEEAVTEIHPGVLDHLLLMIKRGEFISAKGTFSYRKNLSRIGLPVLVIGGENDPLAPPASLRTLHRSVGSADRTARIFGPRSKDSAAYGHFDLILGRKAKEEVFPVIAKWLKPRLG